MVLDSGVYGASPPPEILIAVSSRNTTYESISTGHHTITFNLKTAPPSQAECDRQGSMTRCGSNGCKPSGDTLSTSIRKHPDTTILPSTPPTAV